MTRKGIVRAAFVIAAGFICLSTAPAQAAPIAAGTEQAGDAGKPLKLTKPAKPRAKAAVRTRKPKVVAQRSSKPKTVAARKAEKESSPEDGIPAAIANAKAEMTSNDAQGAAAITAPTPEAAPMEVAASEQLNELDRAISAVPDESQPRSIKTQLVTDEKPQASLPVIVADNSQSAAPVSVPDRAQAASVTAASGDAWAQSSLIGKIFIAFGGMLTLASAARMLIA